MRHTRAGRAQTNFGHGIFKLRAVFCLINRLGRRTDQLAVILGQHAVAMQIKRAIQCGLATHGRQNRIGPLFGNNAL